MAPAQAVLCVTWAYNPGVHPGSAHYPAQGACRQGRHSRMGPPRKRACVCCEPGRIPHDTNPAMCKMCPHGSIAPAASSLQCSKCSAGFTTPNSPIVRTACSVCRPGRAGPACEKCPANTWSPGGDAASTSCIQCLNGAQSAAGSTSDKACKQRGSKCIGANVNACKRAANSNGVCTNVPGVGIECGCNPGYIWVNGACKEVITCSKNPCAKIANTTGSCNDVEPQNEQAYECGCNPGYVWAFDKCEDEQGCAGDPCHIWAQPAARACADLRAPESGFECGCIDGYVLVNGVCQDEDGCAGDPCDLASNPGKMCTDALAPNTGLYCGCKPGYYADRDNKCQAKLPCEAGDTVGNSFCADKLNSNGVCTTKYPAPSDPDTYIYECGCTSPYYFWNPSPQLCQENPGCDRALNPCTTVANSDATCIDVFNSPRWQTWELGYKCACNAGYLWNPRASGSDFNYIGECQANPGGCTPAQNPCAGVADSNGSCTDVAVQMGFSTPLLAYQCACNAGFVWSVTEKGDGNTGSVIAVGSCRRDA